MWNVNAAAPIISASAVLNNVRQHDGVKRCQLVKQVNDTRDIIPVTSPDGALLGGMNRQAALDILLGEGA